MMRWLQRLFWLGVFMGAGYGAYQAWTATTIARRNRNVAVSDDMATAADKP